MAIRIRNYVNEITMFVFYNNYDINYHFSIEIDRNIVIYLTAVKLLNNSIIVFIQ